MNVRQRNYKINTKPKPNRKKKKVNLHFKASALEKRLNKGPRPALKDVVEGGRDVVPENNILA